MFYAASPALTAYAFDISLAMKEFGVGDVCQRLTAWGVRRFSSLVEQS